MRAIRKRGVRGALFMTNSGCLCEAGCSGFLIHGYRDPNTIDAFKWGVNPWIIWGMTELPYCEQRRYITVDHSCEQKNREETKYTAVNQESFSDHTTGNATVSHEGASYVALKLMGAVQKQTSRRIMCHGSKSII
ncbi:hypothetical protein METBIDRAFT_143574 [Metschnikowia bicuspidata var. bicuspidata NRRL YB-4993]|uniref:Uncharacterized protein n=1 Tax=Metschnikowia bicuspidata var. bicuspidata NRRL YB-4993 TaxID=869754 RepID=A0A1A0HDC5_9ASCO|nr:hypothetical protein METBIDRAFT_143574 [Metschnikowia bicuspidata var. bicuspidata NRRL YB-4993]OBA21975.1 hypothetical protein METBIDRAFT_143574 [Metschnikowia bicuspidata var. bicuspidata NRRL YB-4993]